MKATGGRPVRGRGCAASDNHQDYRDKTAAGAAVPITLLRLMCYLGIRVSASLVAEICFFRPDWNVNVFVGLSTAIRLACCNTAAPAQLLNVQLSS